MTSEALICNNNISTKVRVGGGDEIKVINLKLKITKLSTKFMIFAKPTKQSFRSAFLTFKAKVLILQYIFKADSFNCIDALSNNSNKTKYKIHTQ